MKKTLDGGKGTVTIAKVEGDVESKSNAEQLLEAYKKQNPAKYQFKKDRGEFDALLGK